MDYTTVGQTGVELPTVIFGSTILGNIFQVYSDEVKLATIKAMFDEIDGTVVIDSAGKYGAGLALEKIGWTLRELNVPAERVVISNKLAWIRTELTTPEPTFEPGAWFGLEHDAVQDISYDGIIRCFEQGLELVGEGYGTDVVSVHDPDEYLAAAVAADREKRFNDIKDAYRALNELKAAGKAKAIGVGAKDWTSIQEIDAVVDLDWVMFANSMTLYSHPSDMLDFMTHLQNKGVTIINSAVFNAGFLTGGEFFNYRKLDPSDPDDRQKFEWRDKFFDVCKQHNMNAAVVCMHFGKSHPGIASLALSTSKPERVKQNIDAMNAVIPDSFWDTLKDEGLLEADYAYLGT